MDNIVTNANDVAALISKIQDAIEVGKLQLLDQLGKGFVDDVQKRIQTQDSGRWAKASKWIQAKKNTDVALEGADKFVKYRVTDSQLEVYGETDGDWTLDQHDQGFENKVEGVNAAGRIEIDIVNPGPLGLSAGSSKFAWTPKLGIGRTPARKIWADDSEVNALAQPIAELWFKGIVEKAVA